MTARCSLFITRYCPLVIFDAIRVTAGHSPRDEDANFVFGQHGVTTHSCALVLLVRAHADRSHHAHEDAETLVCSL